MRMLYLAKSFVEIYFLIVCKHAVLTLSSFTYLKRDWQRQLRGMPEFELYPAGADKKYLVSKCFQIQ